MSLLHEAVLENSEIKIRKLLKTINGIDINSKDENGNGAIHIASGKGFLKIVKLLIKYGAKIDLQSNAKHIPPDLFGAQIPMDLGFTSLMFAIGNKCLEVVRLLIENGADVNQQFGKHSQVTPLTQAIEKGDLEMVQLLVQNGANVNLDLPQRDPKEFLGTGTTEHYTIRWGSVYGGGTALFAAIRSGNIEIIKYLVENGADVNATDSKTGENPLGLTIEWYQTWKVFKDVDKIKEFESIVKILVENGHNINQFTNLQFSPLMRTIVAKAKSVAEYLINKGANVNHVDTRDDHIGNRPPPIFWAMRKNFPGIAKLLIQKGANIHFRHISTMHGKCLGVNTPLHSACNFAFLGVVQFLVKKGANLEEKNLINQTPLHATLDRVNNKKKLKMVRKIAIFLINQGAEIDEPDDENKTPLYYAAETGELEVAKILIDKGANIEVCCKDNKTLLYLSAGRGDIEMTKLLIEKGAKLNLQCEKGRSPLHVAVQAKSEKVVELLIDNGADLDAKDKDGKTPLEIAKSYSDTQSIIELIIRKMIYKSEECEYRVEPSPKRPKLDDCLICFEPRSEIFMLRPCGHAKTCQVCCLKIVHFRDISTTCPVCRQDVDSYTKAYF